MLKNKIIIWKILIFIAILIISGSLMICCFEHECHGEKCFICYEINFFKNVFESLIVLAVVLLVRESIEKCIMRIDYSRRINYSLTPIKLKVKLLE